MSHRCRVPLTFVIAIACCPAASWAVGPTPAEIARSRQWTRENFPPAGKAFPQVGANESPKPRPFSFLYGGKSSDELLGGWQFSESTSRPDAVRTRRVQTYRDPRTGLALRCAIVEYADFPVVEWTLHFQNEGKSDTPILQDIRSLRADFHRGAAGEFVLHHSVGSPCEARDYAPLETRLGPGAAKRIAAAGGRSTNSDMSYFNLQWSAGGVIVVVGWPGQWAADFACDHGEAVRVSAGQEQTHFTLHPGEEVRTPLSVLLFWQGDDWLRAQNVWRRWFIAHNIRRPGGKLPPIQWCGTSETGTNMMIHATEANQKTFIDAYLARGWKPDFWWMDAGWYPCQGDWTRTGTWELDPSRFPKGLRPVNDYLHSKGIRGNLWFEPERVTPGTWLAQQHPEWVLGGKAGGLLDLGNREAWNWLVDHVDRMIAREAIDIYRQDFNMDPLPFWLAHDRPDRRGITEIGHVTGLLAYWDELLRRHPGVLYDNCASGGRRNDLESMRRGVALYQERLCRRSGRRAGPDLRHIALAPLFRGHLGRQRRRLPLPQPVGPGRGGVSRPSRQGSPQAAPAPPGGMASGGSVLLGRFLAPFAA